MPGLRREIGAAEEGALVLGVDKHRQRPAARPVGQELVRRLVDAIDVGALLPVDLDVDVEAFMSAAVSSSSNDSCAITWHQWQAE